MRDNEERMGGSVIVSVWPKGDGARQSDRFLVFPSFALKFEQSETVCDDTLRDVTHAHRNAAFLHSLQVVLLPDVSQQSWPF